MKDLLRGLVDLLLAVLFLPVHVVGAVFVRLGRLKRRERPRVVWGPTPIGGTHYYSRACRAKGYTSDTVTYGRYRISGASDFDHTADGLFRWIRWLPGFWTLSRHLTFLWALGRYEVHFHNFNGGFLKDTLLVRLEIPLWRLSGGRKVVYPYGGDVQQVSRTRSVLLKDAFIRDYPAMAWDEDRVRRRVRYFARHADFVYVSLVAVDYVPYWDHLVMQLSAIDTDHVDPARFQDGPLRERHPGKRIILHAPNHPDIKGTDLLRRACDELRAEGRDDFELVVLSGLPNEELLQAIHDADIIADQFVFGGYAMFALEGMSMEKPVLCYIRDDLRLLYGRRSWARELPIVDTPPDRIKERLAALLDDPGRCERLGKQGRRFVQAHHSLDAMGEHYHHIIRTVWENPPRRGPPARTRPNP